MQATPQARASRNHSLYLRGDEIVGWRFTEYGTYDYFTGQPYPFYQHPATQDRITPEEHAVMVEQARERRDKRRALRRARNDRDADTMLRLLHDEYEWGTWS